ncbi:Serine/threonine-protein kinase PAK5 [Metarhizium acridum]|nr:Serine/threonine-protein kinase PAK5 [Metarhizium acridum]
MQGGSRKSLLSAGGAQGPANISSSAPLNDEWIFETLDEAREVDRGGDAHTVRNAYGPDVHFLWQPPKQPGRRRQPKVVILTPHSTGTTCRSSLIWGQSEEVIGQAPMKYTISVVA